MRFKPNELWFFLYKEYPCISRWVTCWGFILSRKRDDSPSRNIKISDKKLVFQASIIIIMGCRTPVMNSLFFVRDEVQVFKYYKTKLNKFIFWVNHIMTILFCREQKCMIYLLRWNVLEYKMLIQVCNNWKPQSFIYK